MSTRRELAMDYWNRMEATNDHIELTIIATQIAQDERLDPYGPFDMDRQNLSMKCRLRLDKVRKEFEEEMNRDEEYEI